MKARGNTEYDFSIPPLVLFRDFFFLFENRVQFLFYYTIWPLQLGVKRWIVSLPIFLFFSLLRIPPFPPQRQRCVLEMFALSASPPFFISNV